ncbi:MAG: ABC transporter permease, partial [Candidatus Latescibacterota bacterium]
TLISLLGLTVGTACTVLIALCVDYELRHDAFHRDGDRIYRLVLEDPASAEKPWTLFPADLADVLVREVPGVQAATGFIGSSARVRSGQTAFDEDVGFASPAFLAIFTFPLLHGDPRTALSRPDGVVLTATAVQQLLGLSGPAQSAALGRTVSVLGKVHTVTAVAADPPLTSSLRFDCLMNLASRRPGYPYDDNAIGNTTIYLELAPEANPGAVATAMIPLIPAHLADGLRAEVGEQMSAARLASCRLWLQPLSRVYLDNSVDGHYTQEGSKTAVVVLSAMAALVLLAACANHTILAIGVSTGRGREVGVRQVIGARRCQLIGQFLTETALLSVIACILGLGLAELALPIVAGFTEQSLGWGQLLGWLGPALFTGMLLVTVLAGGAFPALTLSRPRPAVVLKGRHTWVGQPSFLRALLVAECALAMGLVTLALVATRQWTFLRTREVGFQASSVVLVPVPGSWEAAVLYRNAVLNLAVVQSASLSDRSFTSGWCRKDFYGDDGRRHGEVRLIHVDFRYMRTLGLQLVAGRDFDPARPTDAEGAVLVNECLARAQGWADPIGRSVRFGEDGRQPPPTVVGVVRDFHFDSLRDPIEPLALTMDPRQHWGRAHVFVRLAPGDLTVALRQLRSTWESIAPGEPFIWSFLDRDLQIQYRQEESWTRVLQTASVLVLLIASLGLLGQAALTVARRTREIGVRKVHGASVSRILWLFVSQTAVLVAVASVLSWPTCYLMARHWLEGYAYRISVGPSDLLLGAAPPALLALAVTAWHAFRAALANPVDALRQE